MQKLLPAALLAFAVSARAETVPIAIDGVVTLAATALFPAATGGTPARISFLATSDGSGGYSMLNPTVTVGPTTYGMIGGFSATNGSAADNMMILFGSLDVPMVTGLSMSITDPTGSALQSGVLGNNVGTTTGWAGGWAVCVNGFGVPVLDVDVTSVTIGQLNQNVWVAGPGGSNSNSGTSSTDAFATISWAASQATTGDTIRVLPATYDTALGETFPIVLPAGVNLISEQGPATTILDGGGAATGVQMTAAGIVSGLRCTNFGTALDVDVSGGRLLQDLAVDGCDLGIDIHSVGTGMAGIVTIEETRLESCGVGISTLNDTGITIKTNRSLVRSCTTGYRASSPFGVFSSHIIGQNLFLLNDLAIEADGLSLVQLQDCLVARNSDGIISTANTFEVHRSTIVDNTGHGACGVTQLEGTIAWGNGTDLAGTMVVANSNTGDPSLTVFNGNISADPLFRNPAFGDYRLTFGSPCVDTAPATVEVDGSQRPRIVDGDLDALPGRDMGAFELRTLQLAGVPVIGTTVPLELNGPPGGYGVLFASSLVLQPPLFGPFGLFYLPQNQLVPLARVHFDANGRSTVSFAIPDQPANVGTALYLQGLVRSLASPVSVASTDLVTMVVQP